MHRRRGRRFGKEPENVHGIDDTAVTRAAITSGTAEGSRLARCRGQEAAEQGLDLALRGQALAQELGQDVADFGDLQIRGRAWVESLGAYG